MKQDSLINEVYTDFKTAIEAIAENLGVAAEHVYMILVKQQIINSLSYLLLIVLIAILGYVGVLCAKKISIVESGNSKGEPHIKTIHWLFATIACVCVCVVMAVNISMNLDVILTGFFNPEYGAMQEIRRMIR